MPLTPEGVEYRDTAKGRVYIDPETGAATFKMPGLPAMPGPSLPPINPFLNMVPQTPGPPAAGAAGAPDPEALLSMLRGSVANELVPMRQAGLQAALAQLMRMANASPQALLGASAGQRQGLQRQATQARGQVARQVGPSGVGVARRAGRDINQGVYDQLAQLYGQIVGQGEQGIAGIAQGTSALVPTGQQRSSGTGMSTSTNQGAFDPFQTALGLSGLFELGGGLYDILAPRLGGLFGGFGASSAMGNTPGFGIDYSGLSPFG